MCFLQLYLANQEKFLKRQMDISGKPCQRSFLGGAEYIKREEVRKMQKRNLQSWKFRSEVWKTHRSPKDEVSFFNWRTENDGKDSKNGTVGKKPASHSKIIDKIGSLDSLKLDALAAAQPFVIENENKCCSFIDVLESEA